MDTTIEALVGRLTGKSNPAAYQALQQLQRESAESDRVYLFMGRFAEMMDSGNSYQQTRALPLVARYKPELRPVILAALHGANISRYPESMQSLVWKDIRQALEGIEGMGEGGGEG